MNPKGEIHSRNVGNMIRRKKHDIAFLEKVVYSDEAAMPMLEARGPPLSPPPTHLLLVVGDARPRTAIPCSI